MMSIPIKDSFGAEISANYSGPSYADLPMEVNTNSARKAMI